MLKIRCKNTKKIIEVATGSRLSDIFSLSGAVLKSQPTSAKVNNRVLSMRARLYHNCDVEFLDVTSSSGMRAYTRTLFFVLCKAVKDVFDNARVVIDTSVSNGYYCKIILGRELTQADVDAIKNRMGEIVAADIPVRRHEVPTEIAIEHLRKTGEDDKALLLDYVGKLYTEYFEIDGYPDYFYSTLLTSTGQLYLFDLIPYFDGVLLRVPRRSKPDELGEVVRQDMMFEAFREHHHWQELLGVRTVGQFNEALKRGYATDLINVSEALQEKKISKIAEEIASRKGVKLVLLAGPSSSGKTTTCKRLSVQLLTCGIKPVQISLDDYFLDRDKTPKDENGEYDFESLYSLNIPLFNEQMQALFRGEEVELPRYDFPTGKSVMSGKKLRLQEGQVVIMEGIHALNPELTALIPDEQKFKVYASALTSILLDDHNYIPTTDNRLLRRIIRDYKYRGTSAEDTIKRWPSVRVGEEKWIFPYQENADVMFNTAMLFEIAVIKTQAEPILERVPETAPEFSEAHRLLRFLRYFSPLNFDTLPPTSLLREFLGGSSFEY